MEKAKLRIACLEDEEEQTYYLKTVLDGYQKERDVECALSCFRSAEEFLFEHELSGHGGSESPFPYDLLVLDICLGQEAGEEEAECCDRRSMNGMELARRIRKADRQIDILFLSNLREYVFQGYEVGALRYLLKPVTGETLFPVLDLLLQKRREEPAYVLLPVAGEHRRMELGQILYLEAVGHYVRLHRTDGGTMEWKQSFSAALAKLPPELFVRIHRSFCVNLMYVNSITRKNCFLEGGTELPLSRGAYQEANEAFLRYYRDQGF